MTLLGWLPTYESPIVRQSQLLADSQSGTSTKAISRGSIIERSCQPRVCRLSGRIRPTRTIIVFWIFHLMKSKGRDLLSASALRWQ